MTDRRMAIEIRDEMGHELGRLESEFHDGDWLAPLEVCNIWTEKGLPMDALPPWVIDYLVKVAGNYFAAGPFGRVTPREYIEMGSVERRRLNPSLDEWAGLRGTKGKDNPWLRRALRGREPLVRDFVCDAVKHARAGDNQKIVGGRAVRVLDRHGRLRGEFKNEVARVFRLRGYQGDGWDRRRTIDRILDGLDK